MIEATAAFYRGDQSEVGLWGPVLQSRQSLPEPGR